MSLLSSVDLYELSVDQPQPQQQQRYDGEDDHLDMEVRAEEMVYLSYPSRLRALLSSRFFAPTRSPRAASRTCFQLTAGGVLLFFWVFFMMGLGIVYSQGDPSESYVSIGY
jgi:hypothetical protein